MIIITSSMLFIRTTMRVTSHTVPISSTRRTWNLFLCLLVIAVLPLWWWMWIVEGLVLLLLVVVPTSLLDKLGLISRWQSSVQGVNPINGSSNGAFHSLKSSSSGLLVLREYLGHRLHHGVKLFRVNAFVVFVSRW
jgi:hypothetical protein